MDVLFYGFKTGAGNLFKGGDHRQIFSLLLNIIKNYL